MKIFEVLLNDKAYLVEVTRIGPEGATVTVNGTPYEIGIKDLTVSEAPKMMVVSESPQVSAGPAAPRPMAQAEAETVGGVTTIKAPLPGLIIEVKVNVGDAVEVGDVLLVIETMKMENNITSQVVGTVKEIKVSNGESVSEGVPLIVIGE